MENLTNKNAIVSGSSQGIGKETAKLFAERGASVTLLARNKSKGCAQNLMHEVRNLLHSLCQFCS